MSSNPSIDDFLSSYFIGYTLPDIFVQSLESHSHTIGENIDSTAINNSSLYFLVSGQVREIVFLNNQRQTTLYKHSAPFVVGLTSFFGSAINRHLSCSTDCIFVSIPLDKLNLCLDQNPILYHFFLNMYLCMTYGYLFFMNLVSIDLTS